MQQREPESMKVPNKPQDNTTALAQQSYSTTQQQNQLTNWDGPVIIMVGTVNSLSYVLSNSILLQWWIQKFRKGGSAGWLAQRTAEGVCSELRGKFLLRVLFSDQEALS